ncbi:MAG: EscU/YscU/HrcU family type III secretion system export apparatus switch protein [Geminicoccaceae bacterium]|nr:EscU/YscU/HrcU family type III secretion system export apparatus switch protein [Geminicoccaceae bacterium]
MAEPTRTAVAVRYAPQEEGVPRITAKGRGAIAEQIVRVAVENGIPVRRDPDLTGLLAQLDRQSPIPVAAFAAMAEILALLYRANQREADAEGRR